MTTREDASEIGQQFFYGEGRRKSYKKALPFLPDAACAGDPYCQNLVGYSSDRALGPSSQEQQRPKSNSAFFEISGIQLNVGTSVRCGLFFAPLTTALSPPTIAHCLEPDSIPGIVAAEILTASDSALAVSVEPVGIAVPDS